MNISAPAGLVALRVLVALQLVIHGTFRLTQGGVAPFGDWLGQRGLPLGVVIAWVITLTEITGGIALILGRFVRPLCAWFLLQLLIGIAMVHLPDGWFVVGGGRNGMEYSVVLIGCLVIVALTQEPKRRGR